MCYYVLLYIEDERYTALRHLGKLTAVLLVHYIQGFLAKNRTLFVVLILSKVDPIIEATDT